MTGLPQSTEVRRQLPKAQLYRQFGWSASQRERFDADVARLDFVNWVSPQTLPAIAAGDDVKEFFVIEVLLKKRDFDRKSIELLAKAVPQHIVYVLRYEDETMLALFYSKFYTTPWQHAKGMSLQVNGINLERVWDGIVREIVGTSLCDVGTVDDGDHSRPLREEIAELEQREKIRHQIELLQRQMNATKQPRRKREIFEQLQKLKTQHNG